MSVPVHMYVVYYVLMIYIGYTAIYISFLYFSYVPMYIDEVARFHLRNGACFMRLNWDGSCHENIIKNSLGMMVNYIYDINTLPCPEFVSGDRGVDYLYKYSIQQRYDMYASMPSHVPIGEQIASRLEPI